MYTKGLVSIIIPAYNAQNHIIYTLLSVIDQTYPSIEIIVVNDGSTDHTETIIKEFENKGIKYIYQKNGGSVSAKNNGLSHAQGEYIQFLDADDLLGKDKIARQVALLKGYPGKVALCRTRGFPYMGNIANLSEKDEIDSEFLYSTEDPFDFLKRLNGINGTRGMVQPNAYLTPRTVIDEAGPWSVELTRSPDDDSEFFSRVLLKSNGIIYVPECFNYYRRIPLKITLSRRKSQENARGALRTIELKTQHFLSIENSLEVRTMMARQFAGYIYLNFLYHPDLCKKAEDNIRELGISKIPVVGGVNFLRMANIVGFKNALRIKKLLKFNRNG